MQRCALADTIEQRHQDITSQWLDHVLAEVLAGRKVDLSELKNNVALYLLRIAELLRNDGPLDEMGSDAWEDVTQEHAKNRIHLGFDIEQLVHEFVLLRRVLVKLAAEQGVTEASQVERLSDLIDGAIASSVKSYVQSRDYAARKAEAAHLGFLTHELRNPLNTARMAVMQLTRSGPRSPHYDRVLELLEASHDRLQKLIDDVLMTERLEAGAIEPRQVETTLGDVLAHSFLVAHETARSKGIDIHVDYDPSVGLRVDPKLLSSAVQNLVENAVKFTDKGAVQVTIEDRPAEIVFHVHDSCDGISEEHLQVIFEPFRRVHPQKAGTGLGLAIARRAIETQGGAIHVESGKGGCHFWFTLPKNPS